MDTEIQKFFNNKTVFVTGGTGFLGKVLIEKILRCTNIKRIYVLARSRAGQDVKERFNEIIKTPLFDKLHATRPKFMDCVQLMEGDCAQDKLGLSNDDYRTLVENVEVILHCAATVRFNEMLSVATAINVQGTVDIVAMAKEMQHLVSFVHVSTAFVTSTTHTEEKICSENLSVTCQQLLSVKEALGDEKFDYLSSKFVGKFPNTYTFTKAITEDFIRSEAGPLPICIFRPGIILSTYQEPFGGWIDNIQGAAGVTFGVLMGVLRVVNIAYPRHAPIVPVDYCANMILAAAWSNASSSNKSSSTKEIPIYNLIPDEPNFLTWGQYIDTLVNYNNDMPYSKMLWYPTIRLIGSPRLYGLATIMYQTVPAYVMQLFFKISGSKISMLKVNKKIARLTDAVAHFITHDFTFATTNTRHLWQSMSPEDRKLFDFDMTSVDWNEYLLRFAKGLREFIGKEEPETIPAAKSKLKRFYMCHVALNSVVSVGLLWTTQYIFF